MLFIGARGERELAWRPFVVSDEPLPQTEGFCVEPGTLIQPGCDAQTTWLAEPQTALAWFALPAEHPWRQALNRFVKTKRVWKIHGQTLDLTRPKIMAIWNVTPDSFSSQPNGNDAEQAHALELLKNGADILDIGAESTRPGATPLTPQDEIARLQPHIQWAMHQNVVLSIDTYHPETMAWAQNKVHIINDIGMGYENLQRTQNTFKLVDTCRFGYVMTAYHSHKNQFDSWDACIRDIIEQLDQRLSLAYDLGLDLAQIVVDPGIGFGKGLACDLDLIQYAAPEMACLARPVLIAHSRKRCLGMITGRDVDERDTATAIADALAFTAGASIVRVHDTKGACDARAIVCR